MYHLIRVTADLLGLLDIQEWQDLPDLQDQVDLLERMASVVKRYGGALSHILHLHWLLSLDVTSVMYFFMCYRALLDLMALLDLVDPVDQP